MKRGFLNIERAQRSAPQGVESKSGLVRPEVPTKVPHKTVEKTGLPAGYTHVQFAAVESLLTSRSNEVEILTIPAHVIGQPRDPDRHSEWLVRGLMKNKVLNAPGYPHPVPKAPRNVKSCIVKSTAAMGKGVFATRDISMGEIIFAKRPLIVTLYGVLAPRNEHSLAKYTKMAMLHREQQLEVAVRKMEPKGRAQLLALSNCHSKDGEGTLNGIVRTNSYGVHNLTDKEFKPDAPNNFRYSAVCDVGSRINHSCLPNIDNCFKLSAFAIIFYATRDIKAGEQLFYSYCGLDQSASERQAKLASYGITPCTCAPCIHATPETDALRNTFSARIQECRAQSLTWKKPPTFPVEILDDLLRYQRAVVKEGLDIDFDYCLEFLPALVRAYQLADRPNERMAIREVVKRIVSREEVMKLMR